MTKFQVFKTRKLFITNPNNTWGSRSPSADSGTYGFDPEVEQTTQNPEFYKQEVQETHKPDEYSKQ